MDILSKDVIVMLTVSIPLLVFVGNNFLHAVINILQVLRKDDPPRKTYVYRLDIPVAAQWISLVVAPFEILPDPHVGLISHMCLPANLKKLQNTVEFFHNAFKFVIFVF